MSEEVTLSKDELRGIVRDVTKDVTHEVLTSFGFDTKEPNEMQKDLNYLREFRVGAKAVKRTAWRTVIGIVITGAAGLLWAGFKGS